MTTKGIQRLEDFYAIVPAGGAGTRLWPLSRAGSPKFLHDLTGTGRSLLQQTWDRLHPLAREVVVVTGGPHVAAVAGQLPDLPTTHLVAEPSPRDSAAAICLGAAIVHARHPEAVIGSFAADHVIRDGEAFAAVVGQAVSAARAGYVVTMGITPTGPSTAFGYVQQGAGLGIPGASSACAVHRFVEKPDAATAASYLAEGSYRWNAGIFVARAEMLLDELRRARSALHEGVLAIAAAWDSPDRDAVLTREWPRLEKVAIDYAVAEPAAARGTVAVVPADFGWDDIGDFTSLASVVGDDADVTVIGPRDDALSVDSTGLLLPAAGRLLAVVGVRDVVVVDTPDAVLVVAKGRAQDVKLVVEALRGQGRERLM